MYISSLVCTKSISQPNYWFKVMWPSSLCCTWHVKRAELWKGSNKPHIGLDLFPLLPQSAPLACQPPLSNGEFQPDDGG